jgi:hypothetical protein
MNLPTQEIPQDSWLAFFNGLSRQYEGWGVTVEVLNCPYGDQPEGDSLPFQGLSFEAAGSEAGDILVEAGDKIPAFVTHHVDHPRTVRLVASRPGAEADIEIESADGTTTIIRLRRRPELPPAGTA